MAKQPLVGRVALVTASSRYTGAVIAATLCRAGAQTAVHYHKSQSEADALVRQLQDEGHEAATFGGDGRKPKEMRALAEKVHRQFGDVDILVNNLGPYADTPFLELSEEHWDWILDTNLKASFILAQELAPAMIERGWGRIINITAASAFIRSHSVFGLAKAALIYLTEALAVEVAPQVTVNAISPGQIEDSELIDEIDPNYKRILRQESPLGRLVSRQEIADMIVLLCGHPFDSVTGQTFAMDAGWTIPTWDYNVGAVE